MRRFSAKAVLGWFMCFSCMGLMAWSQEGPSIAVPAEENPSGQAEANPSAQAEGPEGAAEAIPATDDQAIGVVQAQEEHLVETGDTLWDLSQKFLQNPWYWPRVWSYNPDIQNPHWIYPGQKIFFYPKGELPGEILASDSMELPESVGEEAEQETRPQKMVSMAANRSIIKGGSSAPGGVYVQRDVFVSKDQIDKLGVIKGSKEEKIYLATLDTVYLEFKNPDVAQVGQQFAIVRQTREIKHPKTGASLGTLTQVLGTAQVLARQEKLVLAEIQGSIDAIHRGDLVMAYEQPIAKNINPQANDVELKGLIVDAREELTLLGEHLIVLMDQGSAQGVKEGNVFDVVRRGDGYTPLGEPVDGRDWDESYPPEVYGRILVIDARPTVSVGIVMASLRDLHIGDRVWMTTK